MFEFVWHPVTKKQIADFAVVLPATDVVSTTQQLVPVDAGDKGCGCSEARCSARCIQRSGWRDLQDRSMKKMRNQDFQSLRSVLRGRT